MKRYGLFIVSLLLLPAIPCLLFAQAKIHGVIVDNTGNPVSGATVLLLHSADSALIKGVVTDNKGNYFFYNIATGNYYISSSHVAFSPNSTTLFQVSPGTKNIDPGILKLEPLTATLTNITIATKRPLYEQKPDRLTINVENSIASAGNTALQILERSPGVVVNRQNNIITMLGKDGVNIMINGKLSYMPASAVIQMLDGMNAESIDKIELITTPPANLDAEGKAGYINIVLKQNENIGTNGSFYGTVGYGKGWVTQAGLNFNHRSSKVNIYGDFSYSEVKNIVPINDYSRISNKGNIYENYGTTDRKEVTARHNVRIGLDYQLRPRTVAGILITSNGRWYRQTEHATAAFNLNGYPDTLVVNANREHNNWRDYGINVNLQQNFNKGGNLTFNAYYLHYKNDQPVNYYSRYYDKAENFVYDETTRSGKSTPLNFWITSLDYSKKLTPKIDLETGVKSTIANFTNKLSFERLVQNNWIEESLLSSVYTMKENYSAAYASLSVAASEKTTLKGGLRYEYTNSKLASAHVNIIDRHYGKIFPTLFFSHKLSESSTINFSYNSRITRPTFTDLAPFTYYTNRRNVLTGNPELQPAISYAVNLGYTFKKYFLQASFTKENNSITFFQPNVDSVSQKTIAKPENLKNQKLVALLISVPVKVANWWSMQYNITGTWQQINAVYQKEPVRIEQKNISINMTQSFTLPKDF
ncbi:MAG: TonB-dependent receptor [Chitinophagaceae bacterium]|nr:TonB-dependent receptor [Chitinophagaceae bacterium]